MSEQIRRKIDSILLRDETPLDQAFDRTGEIISIIEPLIEEAHNISHAVGFRDEVVAEQKKLYGKLKEAKREERERIIGVINDLNSCGFPYGADYKVAVLDALKEE